MDNGRLAKNFSISVRVTDFQGRVLFHQGDGVYGVSANLSDLDEADAALDRAKEAIASLKKATAIFVAESP